MKKHPRTDMESPNKFIFEQIKRRMKLSELEVLKSRALNILIKKMKTFLIYAVKKLPIKIIIVQYGGHTFA